MPKYKKQSHKATSKVVVIRQLNEQETCYNYEVPTVCFRLWCCPQGTLWSLNVCSWVSLCVWGKGGLRWVGAPVFTGHFAFVNSPCLHLRTTGDMTAIRSLCSWLIVCSMIVKWMLSPLIRARADDERGRFGRKSVTDQLRQNKHNLCVLIRKKSTFKNFFLSFT